MVNIPHNIDNYTFVQWTLSKKIWSKYLNWFDKLRAIVFFRIILPKSKLEIIDNEKSLETKEK